MLIRENLSDELLSEFWQGIDWNEAKKSLMNIQRDIAFAAQIGDRESVINAQKRLVRSIEAKALAVRHVSDKVNQPGIDGVKWITDAEKMKAALSLDSKGFIAQPLRLLIVTPRGQTQQRKIQMPTCHDRAMQTLYAYSLDPVSESTADRKSFAFRHCRSPKDAHAYIVRAFESQNAPKYIVKADVKACYASISHEWLLNNVPIDPRVLKQFLKAGHVFAGELFPPDDYGISIGTSTSSQIWPLMAYSKSYLRDCMAEPWTSTLLTAT